MDTIELLVKKKNDIKDFIIPILLVMAMLILVAVGFPLVSGLLWVKLIILILMTFAAVFFANRAKVEYDYCYFQGELQIDRVFNKSSRKPYRTFDIGRAEIVAPLNSHRLDSYRQKNIGIVDVSSGYDKDAKYAAVVSGGSGTVMLIFQSNDRLLDAIYRTVPSRFFRD